MYCPVKVYPPTVCVCPSFMFENWVAGENAGPCEVITG